MACRGMAAASSHGKRCPHSRCVAASAISAFAAVPAPYPVQMSALCPGRFHPCIGYRLRCRSPGLPGFVLHSVLLSLGSAFSLVSFVFVCLSGGRVNLLSSYELHRGVKTSSGLLFAVSSGSCEVGTPLAVGHVPGPVGCI